MFEDFDSPIKTESKENFKPKLEADGKAEVEIRPKIELDNSIKIESFEDINQGMEIILDSDRNDFSIDDQVQNIRDTIEFEDCDPPMKTESKENFKPKIEADMKVEIEVKPKIEIKPKLKLDNNIIIEPNEDINQGMEIILATDRQK